jgi:hypothetical protein
MDPKAVVSGAISGVLAVAAFSLLPFPFNIVGVMACATCGLLVLAIFGGTEKHKVVP